MSTAIQTGSVFPDPAKQQPYRYGRRSSGRFAIVPYESVSTSQIDTLAAQADAYGLNYEVSTTHGKSRIEIEYNYNFINGSFPGPTTESQDVWEIVPKQELKPLLDSRNPLVAGILATRPGAYNQMVQQQRAGTLAANATYDAAGYLTIPTFPLGAPPVNTAFSAIEFTLYWLLLQGVESAPVDVPILTHTKTVTWNYVNPVQFVNLGAIYSSATLIATEAIPTAVLWDFPTDPDPAPLQISTSGIHIALQYGWKKGSPQVREVEKQKFNIVQTYEYGLWPILLAYGQHRL